MFGWNRVAYDFQLPLRLWEFWQLPRRLSHWEYVPGKPWNDLQHRYGQNSLGVADPASNPVFAFYCTIFFDNMAPPWGVGWRKCEACGSPAAHPQFPRCFQRHLEYHQNKHRFLDAFLAQCWFHLASNLAPFWDQCSLQFLGIFPIRFFLRLAAFPIPQIFNFGALA